MRFCLVSGLLFFLLASSAWALTAKDLPVEEARAKNGDVASQVEVGDYYYARGRYAEALPWYRLAAERGQYDARRRITDMYLMGQGTDKNLLKAYVLTRKILATYNLYPESQMTTEQQAKGLERQLTPEQLEEAKKLIQKDWEF